MGKQCRRPLHRLRAAVATTLAPTCSLYAMRWCVLTRGRGSAAGLSIGAYGDIVPFSSSIEVGAFIFDNIGHQTVCGE